MELLRLFAAMLNTRAPDRSTIHPTKGFWSQHRFSTGICNDDGNVWNDNGTYQREPAPRAGEQHCGNETGGTKHHGIEVANLPGALIYRERWLGIRYRMDFTLIFRHGVTVESSTALRTI